MKRTPLKIIPLLLLCAVLALSCVPAQRYQPPPQTGDGWQTATLEEVGLDEGKILEAVDRVQDGTYQNVHSILIVKDGKLVLEEYFSGF